VQASILFHNVFVDEDAIVESSLLLDGVRVGKACQINRCIIDKDVVLPEGTIIGFDREEDGRRFTVTDQGIVVVPKGYQFD
jgi:glucose-1-phosphate adenylyltransferase